MGDGAREDRRLQQQEVRFPHAEEAETRRPRREAPGQREEGFPRNRHRFSNAEPEADLRVRVEALRLRQLQGEVDRGGEEEADRSRGGVRGALEGGGQEPRPPGARVQGQVEDDEEQPEERGLVPGRGGAPQGAGQRVLCPEQRRARPRRGRGQRAPAAARQHQLEGHIEQDWNPKRKHVHAEVVPHRPERGGDWAVGERGRQDHARGHPEASRRGRRAQGCVGGAGPRSNPRPDQEPVQGCEAGHSRPQQRDLRRPAHENDR